MRDMDDLDNNKQHWIWMTRKGMKGMGNDLGDG